MNILLDTNVFIDYVGRQEPFFGPAERVIAAGFFGDAKLWLSAQSIKDAHYVLGHYVNSVHVQRAVRKTLDIVTLVSLSASDTEKALFLEWDDYEDCLIALCALRANADYIVSRDKKGFARSMVPVLSPDEWLRIMEEEHGLAYDCFDFERDEN